MTPGLTFSRAIKSIAVARGDMAGAAAYAAGQSWSNSSTVERMLAHKAAALDSTAMAISLRPFADDLAAYLRPRTILGRLEGMRRVPLRTRTLSITGGTTARWVAEGQPIPATSADLLGGELEPLRVSTVVVLTRELVQQARPSADMTIAADAGDAIALAMDKQFIDPALTGESGVSPASITAGATQLTSTGSSVTQIDADLRAMIGELVDANMPLSTAVFVLSPATATYLALARNGDGGPAYPQMRATGGVLAGLPALTSAACAASGSPGERFIALIETGEVLLADDGDADTDYAEHASVQLVDTSAAAEQPLVSLWQHNLVGMRLSRFCNWRARRAGAVVVLRDVAY